MVLFGEHRPQTYSCRSIPAENNCTGAEAGKVVGSIRMTSLSSEVRTFLFVSNSLSVFIQPCRIEVMRLTESVVGDEVDPLKDQDPALAR